MHWLRRAATRALQANDRDTGLSTIVTASTGRSPNNLPRAILLTPKASRKT